MIFDVCFQTKSSTLKLNHSLTSDETLVSKSFYYQTENKNDGLRALGPAARSRPQFVPLLHSIRGCLIRHALRDGTDKGDLRDVCEIMTDRLGV